LWICLKSKFWGSKITSTLTLLAAHLGTHAHPVRALLCAEQLLHNFMRGTERSKPLTMTFLWNFQGCLLQRPSFGFFSPGFSGFSDFNQGFHSDLSPIPHVASCTLSRVTPIFFPPMALNFSSDPNTDFSV